MITIAIKKVCEDEGMELFVHSDFLREAEPFLRDLASDVLLLGESSVDQMSEGDTCELVQDRT